MKLTRLSKFLVYLLPLLICSCSSTASTINLPDNHNPVITTEGLADPAIIYYDDKYYLYPTSSYNSDYYDVYVSDNLLNWTKSNQVFSYIDQTLWAPDIYFNQSDKVFYLYYSLFTMDNPRIGVAIADNPLGPFEDQGFIIDLAIDAHLFEDDDGQLYLYYEKFVDGCGQITVQRMATPIEPEGNPVTLLKPEGWESQPFFCITEGPWMLKRDGVYYLMYSGNAAHTVDYAIGYATSSNPTGPFTRFEGNPIVSKKDGILGPGHNSVIRTPDGEFFIVYHQKTSEEPGFDDRVICVDHMGFDENGQIWVEATPINYGNLSNLQSD